MSSPFAGTVELFFTSVSPRHLSVVGHITSNGRPVQGTVFIFSDTTARLFFIESPLGGNPSRAVGADLSLATGSGEGWCERPAGNPALDCGQEVTPVSVGLTACPS